MGTIITDGSATVTPDLVLGYTTGQDSRNIIHVILGRSDPDVSLVPAGMRRGSLKLFFLDAMTAEAARVFHAQGAKFTLSSDDEPTIGMTYVLDGSLSPAIDDDTMTRWTLDVPYQEVLP